MQSRNTRDAGPSSPVSELVHVIPTAAPDRDLGVGVQSLLSCQSSQANSSPQKILESGPTIPLQSSDGIPATEGQSYHHPRGLQSVSLEDATPLDATEDDLRSPRAMREAINGSHRAPGVTPRSHLHDDDRRGDSYGTLMLSNGGQSKYLGPTAGTAWLKDSEAQGMSETPNITRPHSPDSSEPLNTPHPPQLDQIAFPFNDARASISTRDLLSRLPPREEAWTLVESYYRYCAWHHDVAPRTAFSKTFDRVYTAFDGLSLSPQINPQELALLFIIMAQGTLHNIEMPHYDSSANEWLHLSERALVKGEFLSSNTIAGLQTLHLMAHLNLQQDEGRRGDSAWPLWGLVMRLVQAMGMHRDGARWNLRQDVVEERRKVFWECNAGDIFQAHCFSRPCAINPDYCDTAFPSSMLEAEGGKSYYILRFELSQISAEILDMTMKIRKPGYSTVTELDSRLSIFEQNLPFALRCRAALLSMPSRYPSVEEAIKASPEPSRRAMKDSFQQTNLALNISETVINLHRPYYAKALCESVDNQTSSLYAPSFFAVIERCAIIIALVSDIHTRFPAVSTRQWNLWFHVFGSALCLGTLILRDPGNAMAAFVLAQIDVAISLFTSLIQHGAGTPRYRRNLKWLQKLRIRASAKNSAAPHSGVLRPAGNAGQQSRRENREDGEDMDLLGWRTRLIERANQNPQHRQITELNTTPNGDSSRVLSNDSGSITFDTSLPFTTPDSTNDFLHDFWDPMLLQDIFEAPDSQPNNMNSTGLAWWDDPGLHA
ncbi:hypothetical protein K461DRAFT_278410 [Myriangium duriaei CBS 260.36]|uniref:Xylanolytic transcriptional activator regulatory domain-containing protein n=1 Tax=Myriangium duriaei CBS 260.36 TaxID=1168546 RepID=A0A9P4J3V5_9PEZI|nr:hypothetical protein K461DRAFT_278410 [Myriangium duriaei CBS 260.36]